MTPRTLTSIVTGLLFAGLAGLSTGRVAAEDTAAPLYQGRYRTSAAVGGEVCSALMALPQSLLGALGSLQISCLPIDLDEPPDLDAVLRRERIQVLYVSPLRAFPVEDVVLLARSSGITTLTGVPRYVETGCAAQLLKLARVVGDRTGL